MKTASGAILGSAFFAPGCFLVDFGLPLGSQTVHFGATFGRLSRLFGQLWATMCFSFDRGCSGTVPGSILGASGCLPGGVFREFWVVLAVASVICCTLVLFQFRPKFVQIPDQSLLCRWFWPWLACPSVAGAVVSRSVLNYQLTDHGATRPWGHEIRVPNGWLHRIRATFQQALPSTRPRDHSGATGFFAKDQDKGKDHRRARRIRQQK